eukprot:m.258240 g.258240  ORF g.258240 m.258240 type:complete len:52 (-) comp15967_c0_seq2:1540-1695(-)
MNRMFGGAAAATAPKIRTSAIIDFGAKPTVEIGVCLDFKTSSSVASHGAVH